MEGISHPNIVNIITHAVTENTRQKCATPHCRMLLQPVLCVSGTLLMALLSTHAFIVRGMACSIILCYAPAEEAQLTLALFHSCASASRYHSWRMQVKAPTHSL